MKKDYSVNNKANFLKFVQNIFALRRKTLVNNLREWLKISKDDAEKYAELNTKTEYGEVKVEGKWIFAGSEGAIKATKGNITSIERSNDGYEWDWNERSLLHKKVPSLSIRSIFETYKSNCFSCFFIKEFYNATSNYFTHIWDSA